MQSYPPASESAAAGVSAATTPGPEMTTKGKKILLIDDDASLRTVLVEQLELLVLRRGARRSTAMRLSGAVRHFKNATAQGLIHSRISPRQHHGLQIANLRFNGLPFVH